MQLQPVYGTEPLITLDGAPSSIIEPGNRQRIRLGDSLATLSDEQLSQPSRCEGWSVRDVVVHLTTTNTFWAYSIKAGLAGNPTTLLSTFDPVAGPAQMTAQAPHTSSAELIEGYVASATALSELLAPLSDEELVLLAEAPPGHQAISTVAHHALWDCWIHERDIMIPLGLTPPVEADEVCSALRYVAALGPALHVSTAAGSAGTLAIEATDPGVDFAVEAATRVAVSAGKTVDADLTLTGTAEDLVEQLSFRAPLTQDVPASAAWLLSGLAAAFDVE